MQNNRNNYGGMISAALRGAVFGTLLAVAFGGGFFLRETGVVDTPWAQASSDYPVLNEVHLLLEENYLRPLPDGSELEYGAIRGMVDTLDDRHTFFIPPAVAQNESDALAGEYGGIGVEIKRDSAGDYVLYPYPDSPAAEAGILDADKLLAVGDTPVTPDMLHDDVRRLVRGEVGDRVTVTVEHRDTDTTESFEVAFAKIQVPSVIWSTLTEEPSFGYISVLRFTSRTPEELEEALRDLQDQGITALVLDLRGNLGGLVQEAVEVASLFLDGGPVLYEVRKDNQEEVKEADAGGLALDLPLVVLVDSSSASASELVAGAMQDRGRAILIGQRTYGKGSVQLIFSLSDGASLHVTAAEWFTPDRNAIDGMGLTPDIEMIHSLEYDAELSEGIRYLRELVAAPQ